MSEPRIAEFIPTKRSDGWEEVVLTNEERCYICELRIRGGWMEMESDIVVCRSCVPMPKDDATLDALIETIRNS